MSSNNPQWQSSQPSANPPSNQYPGYDAQGYDQSSGYYQQPDAYGQPGYPAPQYSGYGAYGAPYGVLPDHPQATLVLVLGIISLVVTGLTGPFAWYFGQKARNEIRDNPGRYKDGGSLTVGWVLGIIGTALLLISVVVLVIYIIVIVGVVASSSTGG